MVGRIPYFGATGTITSSFIPTLNIITLISDSVNWRLVSVLDQSPNINFSLNTVLTTEPTKAALNTGFGSQKAGYRRAYTALASGAKIYTKLDDTTTSDWGVASMSIAP